MDWTIEFDKAIEQYLPDLEVLQDEPMSRHTTFRIAVRQSGWHFLPAGSSWCC